MVLGGQPPGRVGRSQIGACRSGGTGRRTGLKILRNLYFRTGSIPVFGTNFNIAEWSSWQLVGLITRRSQVRVLPPQPNKYGPLVKRSRHRPFTAVTGVRFPYESPCGCSSMVEFRPSKPAVRVRSPSPAPFDYPGTIAQLGEHLPYKQGVTGSSPVGPTIK